MVICKMKRGCIDSEGREGRANQKNRLGVKDNSAEIYYPLHLKREAYGKQIELMLM